MKKIAALLLTLCPFAAAHGGDPAHTGIAPPTRIPDPVDTSKVPHGSPIATSEVPRAVRRAVVADAARRLSVSTSAVVLTRAERVTWPDGSLGCPEPGRIYTQAVVAGFRLVAETTEGQLLYHTDALGRIANCALAPVAKR
jgi:hypothetical protein